MGQLPHPQDRRPLRPGIAQATARNASLALRRPVRGLVYLSTDALTVMELAGKIQAKYFSYLRRLILEINQPGQVNNKPLKRISLKETLYFGLGYER